jgi:hypothetical protein
VNLKVYDVLEREMATLVNGQEDAGEHEAEWNGEGCATGVYLYRLSTGSQMQVRKMILIR